MAYTLEGTSIRAPTDMGEDNSTLYAAQRPLAGNNARDYFGSNKRVWTLNYRNLNITDFGVINTIYQNYLTSKAAVAWAISETNYTVNATTVHVDLASRQFSIPGSDYLSDATLTLTEA